MPTFLILGLHAPEGYSTCPVCLYVCVCLCVCPAGANLRTGTSRRLTENTSGLSGTLFTKLKGIFSKTIASAIMVLRKRMHVCTYEAIVCAHTYMHRPYNIQYKTRQDIRL